LGARSSPGDLREVLQILTHVPLSYPAPAAGDAAGAGSHILPGVIPETFFMRPSVHHGPVKIIRGEPREPDREKDQGRLRVFGNHRQLLLNAISSSATTRSPPPVSAPRHRASIASRSSWMLPLLIGPSEARKPRKLSGSRGFGVCYLCILGGHCIHTGLCQGWSAGPQCCSGGESMPSAGGCQQGVDSDCAPSPGLSTIRGGVHSL
jgi:hypothetical protein